MCLLFLVPIHTWPRTSASQRVHHQEGIAVILNLHLFFLTRQGAVCCLHLYLCWSLHIIQRHNVLPFYLSIKTLYIAFIIIYPSHYILPFILPIATLYCPFPNPSSHYILPFLSIITICYPLLYPCHHILPISLSTVTIRGTIPGAHRFPDGCSYTAH